MRLINVDALPNIYHATHQELVLALEEAPIIDAVPVVRCKDCKHYDGLYCWMFDTVGEFGSISYDSNPDDYCSRGERGEDGQDW